MQSSKEKAVSTLRCTEPEFVLMVYRDKVHTFLLSSTAKRQEKVVRKAMRRFIGVLDA